MSNIQTKQFYLVMLCSSLTGFALMILGIFRVGLIAQVFNDMYVFEQISWIMGIPFVIIVSMVLFVGSIAGMYYRWKILNIVEG